MDPNRVNVPAMAPQALERALTLPAIVYSDPSWFEWELGHVLGRHWQLAGHMGQLPRPQSFASVQVNRKSVLLTRDGHDQVRAFHNVCRHRGGPLVLEHGCGKTLQCKYHGWTYDLTGQCKKAGEMREAEDFDPSQMKLFELPCAVWHELIFVASSTPPPFEEWLGGMADLLKPNPLPMPYVRTVSYEVACNWKVYVENYLEGYHLPFVHPGLNQLLSYNQYKTQLFRWYSHQSSPIQSDLYGDGQAHYIFMYPNMMLNILPNRLQSNLVIPLSPTTCRVVFDYYTHQTSVLDRDIAFSDEVQGEDIHICERVQQGLMSGAYQAGRISPSQEKGVWHFQELIRAAWDAHVTS